MTEGNITACVVSYHKGAYTLALHIDDKLHTYAIKASVLAVLSSCAARALGSHITEVESGQRADRARQTAQELRCAELEGEWSTQDRMWLNRTMAAIDPHGGGLAATPAPGIAWRDYTRRIGRNYKRTAGE